MLFCGVLEVGGGGGAADRGMRLSPAGSIAGQKSKCYGQSCGIAFGDGVLFWILLEELERFQFCIERFVGDELSVDHCRAFGE